MKLLRRIICWSVGHRYVQVGGQDQERCDRCQRRTRRLPCAWGCGAQRHSYTCDAMRADPTKPLRPRTDDGQEM